MEKICYTIGEVAGKIGENTSTVRFWSDSFPKFIRPGRNAKGNRIYSPEDIETLKLVRFLLKTERLTVEGAAKRLQEDRKGAERKFRVVESLTFIREQLVEISLRYGNQN